MNDSELNIFVKMARIVAKHAGLAFLIGTSEILRKTPRQTRIHALSIFARLFKNSYKQKDSLYSLTASIHQQNFR